MIVPNERFRPNPSRAIHINGVIDQQMVQRLTPRIVFLQSQSRAPITVYIDSPGGRVDSMRDLWRLLNASDQDFRPPSVVTTRAASAAADLLSSGDYAIAYPKSTILYHGSRTLRDRDLEFPLTAETTSMLSLVLRLTNETSATELLRKIESRFMFRFLFSKPQFGEIRAKAHQAMSDTDCFLSLITEGLSMPGRKLFETAKERQGRYNSLLNIAKNARKPKGRRRHAAVEASQLRALVDFEVAENKKNKEWTFQNGGLVRLNEDFFLLNEHFASSQSNRIDRLCTQWGRFALSETERAEIDRAPEASKDAKLIQKVRPLLEPLWAFFVALCHALQEGENGLTATDAFWLGLIDEVNGAKGLRSIRVIAEYKEDPPEEEPPTAQPNAPKRTKGDQGKK